MVKVERLNMIENHKVSFNRSLNLIKWKRYSQQCNRFYDKITYSNGDIHYEIHKQRIEVNWNEERDRETMNIIPLPGHCCCFNQQGDFISKNTWNTYDRMYSRYSIQDCLDRAEMNPECRRETCLM